MERLKCLRCGAAMDGPMREKIQLGEQGFLSDHWAHLLAGALEVDIFTCPNCRKVEFFAPGGGSGEDTDPDALPQKECPGCGLSIDFDYPKCPCCGYDFYAK